MSRIDLNLLTFEFDAMEWKKDAACKGMDIAIFFPKRGEPNSQAIKVCNSCSVTEQCLAYAMDNFEKYGVWGGRSERQRRGYRREVRQTSVRKIGPTTVITSE